MVTVTNITTFRRLKPHIESVSVVVRAGHALPLPEITFPLPLGFQSSNNYNLLLVRTSIRLIFIHTLTSDRVRTETYREAIMRHQSFIAGKVVVDVGCGTGILSIFCAQAGAKRVYAIDASDIALQANEVVKENNLSDVVIVLHGRVESMLGSVITARDRWLKPGGLILPSNATLYMAPVTHTDRYSESIDFWRNVYGINMSALIPLAKQSSFEEPSVETISGENILTWPHEVKHIDSYSVSIHELKTVTSKFKFSSMMRAPLHGFAFWFDVEFNGPAIAPSNYLSTSIVDNHMANGSQRKKRTNPNEALVLSTAPEDPPTHWQQVVVDVGCGTGILSIFCAQAGAKRVYAIDASDIALQANEVVKENNLSDVVIVLHGRVESMLGSVITARDRWLKPGGLILPSNATLYMAPVTHTDRYSESIDFWRNVYGINSSVYPTLCLSVEHNARAFLVSALIPLAKQSSFEEPSVETISGENILTWPHEVKHIDSYSVSIHELKTVTSKFKFSSMMRAPLHGFAFWFDVEFNGPAIAPSNYLSTSIVDNHMANGSQRKKRTNPNEALVLSTAPEDPPTHWQQTLIYLYDPIALEQDQLIEGSVTLSQSKENARFMNIHLEYSVGGRNYVKESVMK
ncbi:hypothetical protein TanjilG_31074 [Lupinus angustifolius]|uniref:Protein arginine N-methyltransferase domain-containing protein n=1 Tax=Lupinus angustifolius TaxID=3871 RepID=A0A4P1R4S9_LUPAN|nr:hypothetical protein TanjilG_31074 [Lupinus angustifolius]